MNHINYFSDYKMNNWNNLDDNRLDDVDTGFLKGNMFKNLYDPYKNFNVPRITPKNDLERLMYEIQKYGFAMNDLVLYLDVYPNDDAMVRKFVELQNDYKRAVSNYENKYGPINLKSTLLDKTPWAWQKNWPFEVKR